jgi:hypothetical protein
MPIALLLRSGYGCAGYFNTAMNVGLDESIVLMNARLIDLTESTNGIPRITDFNDFLEEIVSVYVKTGESAGAQLSDTYGRSIPLAAIPLGEISVLYPIAQIGKAMHFIKSTHNPAKADTYEVVEVGPNLVGKKVEKEKPKEKPKAQVVAKTPAKTQASPVAPPVGQEGESGMDGDEKMPRFLDFENKSIVVAILRTKIW